MTATSQFRDLPAFAPSAAADGDPLTAWISEPEAGAPALTLRWDGPVPVDTLGVAVLGGVADPVGRVVVTVDGTSYERTLDASGQVAIPSTTTDEITVSFPGDPAATADARQVAVAEVTIPALLGRSASVADRSAPVELACGDGPPVVVDGRSVETRATTTVGALLDGSPIPWTACSPVPMDAGTHRVGATAGALLVSTLVVEPVDGVPPPPDARPLTVGSWGRETRSLDIGAGEAAIVATTENANDGWEATLDGEVLTPIQVDGWRQGWLVPAGGDGTIELRFTPGGPQRAGLALGLVALLLLVAAAVWAPRRRAGRRTWQPPAERVWPAAAAWGLAVLAGVALGGPVVLVLVPMALLPRRDRWLPIVAACAAVGAGAITFVWAGADVGDTTGTFSGAAQALAVTAVLAVALALLPVQEAESGAEGA